ncbi:MAG: hypothetical protein ABEJ98_00640 [Candidatus Nanohaloarchaea archaeon]
MNAEITSVKENPLLDRKELEVEIEHEGEPTPSSEDVKNRIAAENDIDTDEIRVEGIYTNYGSKTSRALLKVFEDFDYSEELEEDEIQDTMEEEDSEAVTETTEEYEEIVSGTITDAKDALKDMEEPDYEAALEAEKANKDRKTLREWLESQLE